MELRLLQGTDYKTKLTYSENAQKWRCNANTDTVQLIVNQRQRKREIEATLFCLYSSVKLLTDDHNSDIAAV